MSSKNVKYKKSGSAGFKGVQYEYRLVEHFMLKGIENDQPFRLASNMDGAGKWDDIVYHKTDTDRYTFVQAKCKKGSITLKQLLSDDGDFSLVKYFFSYQAIVDSGKYGKGQDFVLLTTCGIDEAAKNFLEESEARDKIFYFGDEHLCYRFKTEIVEILRPNIENYQLTRLAHRLADCLIKENQCFGQPGDASRLVEPYMPILIDKVFDISQSKRHLFHSDFLKDNNLDDKTRTFRSIFAKV